MRLVLANPLDREAISLDSARVGAVLFARQKCGIGISWVSLWEALSSTDSRIPFQPLLPRERPISSGSSKMFQGFWQVNGKPSVTAGGGEASGLLAGLRPRRQLKVGWSRSLPLQGSWQGAQGNGSAFLAKTEKATEQHSARFEKNNLATVMEVPSGSLLLDP